MAENPEEVVASPSNSNRRASRGTSLQAESTLTKAKSTLTVIESSPGDESDEGRFERYENMIGSGSFKVVYEAFDTHEGCNVAWSVVNVRSLSKEMKAATINERKLLEAIGDKSEYLINLKKTWYNAEKCEVVFITELCSGGSLNDFLYRSGTVRLSVLKKVLKQVLQGLVVLHEHGAIHRDLKAENVYVQKTTGNVRIGDYGLAAYSGPGTKVNVGKTMTGTPCFMAPEVLTSDAAHQYNEKVDIWSFGLVVVELITSQQPYLECPNLSELLINIQKGRPPLSLQTINHKESVELITACLKFNGDERPSAAELLEHVFFKTTKTDSKTTTKDMLIQVIDNDQLNGNYQEYKDEALHSSDVEVVKAACIRMVEHARQTCNAMVEQAKEESKQSGSALKKTLPQSIRQPSLEIDLLSDNAGSSVHTEDLLGLSDTGTKGVVSGSGSNGSPTSGAPMILRVKKISDNTADLMSSFIGTNDSGGSSGGGEGDLLGELNAPSKSRPKKKLLRLNSGINELASSYEGKSTSTTISTEEELNDEDCKLLIAAKMVVGEGEKKEEVASEQASKQDVETNEGAANTKVKKPTSSYDTLLNNTVTGLRMGTAISDVARSRADVKRIFYECALPTKTLTDEQFITLCSEFGLSKEEADAFLLVFHCKKGEGDGDGEGEREGEGEAEARGKEISLDQFLQWFDKQCTSLRGNTQNARRSSSAVNTSLVEELKKKYHSSSAGGSSAGGEKRVGGGVAPKLLEVKKLSLKDNTLIPPLAEVLDGVKEEEED